MELSFILIAAELWKKLEPENEDRGILISLAFDHIQAERYGLGEGLSRFTMKDARLSEECRLKASLNFWQAVKWQDRFESVRQEIEKADFSAKAPLFRLARFALLEEGNEFFELLPEVLKSGTLKPVDVDIWPIFKNMRTDPRYIVVKNYLPNAASRAADDAKHN